MKRSNLLAIFAIALTCVAVAQVSMAATVTGTVVSKTADTIVISTPNGQQTYTVSGANLYPAGMDVGSRVTIDYMPSTTGGRITANSIVMASGSAPSMGTTSTTETSRSTTTTTSTSPVTGTVVSKTTDTIVISTPSGQRTFMVSQANLFPTDMDVGDRVTVTFTPGTAGAGDRADRIMLSSSTTSTTTSTDYASSRTGTTSTYDRDDDLPDTAGPVPVLAGLGLAALAGGLVLRAFSRRRANS
jgi:RNase P/RNase MRP subunit p29